MNEVLAVTGWSWLVLAAGAALVGFGKTGIPGVSALGVAAFAAVLPARESTGALLALLLVGDIFAVRTYRRHADWAVLLRLVPSVAVGVLLGVAFVARVDDTFMRRTIGAVLLALVAVHVITRSGSGADGAPPAGARRHLLAAGYGALAGFTTMVANAGGAVMSLYLLSAGATVLGFLGTAAWFFFLVNMLKVPFSVGLGLITVSSLVLDLTLVPAVLLGAALGRVAVRRINQQVFERVVLAATVLASVNLLR